MSTPKELGEVRWQTLEAQLDAGERVYSVRLHPEGWTTLCTLCEADTFVLTLGERNLRAYAHNLADEHLERVRRLQAAGQPVRKECARCLRVTGEFTPACPVCHGTRWLDRTVFDALELSEPSAQSLRDMPEVDFTGNGERGRYRVSTKERK